MRSLFMIMLAMLFLVPSESYAQAEDPADEATEEAAELSVPDAPADDALPADAEPDEAADAEPDEAAEVAPAAEAELEEVSEVISTFQVIIEAARAGNWGLLAASVLMIMVWVLRRFVWTSINADWLPYVTVGVAAVVSWSGAVISGAAVLDALWVAAGGLFAGLSAVGLWELLGKKILGKPDDG